MLKRKIILESEGKIARCMKVMSKKSKTADASVTGGAAVLPRSGRKLSVGNRRSLELSMMVLIPMIILIIFKYVPMFGVILAFKDFQYEGIMQSPWVGLKNFKFLFSSQDAWRITKNTLGLNFLFILTTQIGGIVFAIILNEIRSRGAIRFYQTAMFMPHILSSSVLAYVAFAFLDVNYGFLNRFLMMIGNESIQWYSEPSYWPAILVIINLWKGLGYSVIIYYASLMGIDSTYYEAASIDGANRWQSTWHITLPMLLPITITLFLMNIGKIFYADFGLFYMVPKDSGMLYPTTDVIDTYVYRALRQGGDTGIAAATGLYQSIVGFCLVLFTNWLVKRYDKDYGLF